MNCFLRVGMGFGLAGGICLAQTPGVPVGSSAILQELAAFRQTATVLYVAAHPDDENTQLIAYFARGRGYRTGYLSMTRGEGGQDLIGPELGDELGLMRTQELLAARRIDGGRQFFTRARDFGFSKDYRQTLQRWDRAQILSDIVRVIRTFRPDVMITRFPPKASETHGHHTASAVLAVEAFKLAGDPAAFPEQGLPPWQPKRILWDAFRPDFRPGAPAAAPGGARGAHVDIGGFNPLLGLSFGEIAALSRSNHRTQGFGAVGTRGARSVYFQPLGGIPSPEDPFGDIDTTWTRYPDGAPVAAAADQILARFDPVAPEKSITALLALRSRLASLAAAHPGDPVIADRSAQLDRILRACLGLYVEATTTGQSVVPGETLRVKLTAISRSNEPVRWNGTPLVPNEAATRTIALPIPATQPPSQPYWLREPERPGMFTVSNPNLIGQPESPPDLATPLQNFTVGGQTLSIALIPTQVTADPARGEVRVPVKVIPPVSLAFAHEVSLFAPGATHEVTVIITAARAAVAGSLALVLPEGGAWKASPAQPFHLALPGQRVELTFQVTAPLVPATADFSASAQVGGVSYANQRIEIRYEHIPFQLLQPAVKLHALSVDLAIRGQRIGYLPGAGDTVADCLTQMGYTVTPLTGQDLTLERLRNFDAVVIGIRAFNVRTDLASHLDGLFGYVHDGGTVVEQYNTPNELRVERLGPYPIELDRNLPHHRITNESSPITFLGGDHPAWTTPNRIGPDDFLGWVQERGLNFPSEWDDHYVPLLSSFDPEERPQTGALLVAHYGKGYFVYTGLSFFRQLPAGVPGAYRVFANLLSLGK
jgi:LmbE family N-acetylglucosaminyl deacetylase